MFRRIAFTAAVAGLLSAGEGAGPTPLRAAETAGAVDALPGIHDAKHRQPIVTHLAFSPDGTRVAAAYFIPAQNRPGTDWRGWTAQWDLATGQRLILMNAIGPVAFSPNGNTLAMGVLERSEEPNERMWPIARLGLWRFGAKAPDRVLEREGPVKNTVAAVAFHPDGRHLAVMTDHDEVLLWPLGGEGDAARPLKLVNLGRWLRYSGWGGGMAAADLAFTEDGRLLTLAVPAADAGRRGEGGPRRAWDIHAWKIDATERVFESVGAKPPVKGTLVHGPDRARSAAPPAAVSPDGKLPARITAAAVIELYRREGEERPYELRLDEVGASGVKLRDR